MKGRKFPLGQALQTGCFLRTSEPCPGRHPAPTNQREQHTPTTHQVWARIYFFWKARGCHATSCWNPTVTPLQQDLGHALRLRELSEQQDCWAGPAGRVPWAIPGSHPELTLQVWYFWEPRTAKSADGMRRGTESVWWSLNLPAKSVLWKGLSNNAGALKGTLKEIYLGLLDGE